MTTLNLSAHPSTPCSFIRGVTADIERRGTSVHCRFVVEGDMRRLRIPAAAATGIRTEGLWRHTCFELFVREQHCQSYAEFNFSPSGHWAAWHFDDYRQGMRDLALEAPLIFFSAGETRMTLGVEIATPLEAAKAWDIGASLVLEDLDGQFSWWALRHPYGKPDFHHDMCFAAHM